MTGLQQLRAAARPAVRWRNGGGVTREVARGAADGDDGEFDWRISIAEVDAAGPFSTYGGVRRTIVPIAGGSMVLTIDGVRHVLALYQPLTFNGSAMTSCALPDGPTRDLNLMTTIGRATGGIEVEHLADGTARSLIGADPLVLIALAGRVVVLTPDGRSSPLDQLDAARWSSVEPIGVCGPGVVAAVRLAAG